MINQEEYQARRAALAQRLPDGAIAIIPAADELLRNGDAHFRFRQDSNFYYLTGFNEPDAVLIIAKGLGAGSILFNRSRNPAQEQWTGKRLGQDDAAAVLGIDTAFPIDSFPSKLPELLLGKTAVYFPMGRHPAYEKVVLESMQILKNQIRRGVQGPESLCEIDPIIGEMRLIKSEAEIDLMRRAAAISVAAHQRAMRACKHLDNEYQLEAELIYEFARGGCRYVAYDPIVGGGANSCILHYTENNQPLQKGDLLLIDAGGEFENYAADITRTFPINGSFSVEQRQIYELVLRAQKAGVACIKPGLAWNQIQMVMVEILTQGLVDLGLLKGDTHTLIETGAYKPFYMHNSGHWLGLDVHDAGAYKINNEWRPLEAGMVLTVEPGIYISPDMPGVDSRWWGIGVRIEDDVLVTRTGHENLTAALPVDIAEIEALMRD